MFVLYAQVNAAYATANDLKDRVDRITNELADERLKLTQLEASEVEQDTQLRASIDDDNKSLAWQLRINAILWEQAFHGKSTLPISNAFYPNIANGNSR